MLRYIERTEETHIEVKIIKTGIQSSSSFEFSWSKTYSLELKPNLIISYMKVRNKM